ncbi:MAG: hypothetical protein H9802_11725 [Candidatus Phocaeicola faecipullorum]|nr:hypothetical protein [Candidatus Phocaeicola faecipullorum]
MKTLKTIPVMMLLAAALLSCEKSGPENPDPVVPPVPEENTLEVDKTDISLCYLERDTINVPGVDAADVQWSIAEGGDGIITLLDNVVVGRRKGEATVVASYNGESAAIKVTVTTEEYIPVEKLIWEINGQRVESVDDENTGPSVSNVVYYQWQGGSGFPIYTAPENTPKIPLMEYLDVKIVGYEPEDASCPILAGVNGSMSINAPTVDEVAGYSGFFDDLEVLHLERTEYVNDEYLIYHLYPFPPDLQPTSYDIDQMSASYRSPENEVEYYNANKFLCFDVASPNIENQNDYIYIKSGENKDIEEELAIVPFVPKGLEHTYQYALGWVMSDYSLAAVTKDIYSNKTHCGKLHLSENNILSLDSDFSFDDIENAIRSGKCDLTDYGDYSGNIDNLRTKDTIRIGTLAVLLLPTDGLYYNMVKEQYGAEYAAIMSKGLTGAVICWVKE